MDKKIDLIDTYENMLSLVGMECTKDGFVRMAIGEGEYLPVLGKDGKVVVLPIPDRLRDPKVVDYEVFHLLSDNSKTNDPDLLARYRHWMINRFNIVIGGMGDIILSIVADKDLIKKLRPDQNGIVEMVEQSDQRAIDDFSAISVLAATPNQVKQVFMSMYVKPAQVIDKKSYARIATINFPFYEQLIQLEEELAEVKKTPKGKPVAKVEREVFGVPIRIKDQETYKGLMHFLIPNLEIKHAYDLGTNSRIAPSLDAMMRAFLPLAAHLNNVGELLKKLDPRFDAAIDQMEFNLEWADAFQNLDGLWDQIRMLPQMNYGTMDQPDPTAATKVVPGTPVRPAPPWNTPMPAPVVNYQTIQTAPSISSDGAINVAAMMQRNRPVQPQYVAPQPMNGPQRLAPNQRQAPNIYNTGGGGYPQPSGGYPAPAVGNMGGTRTRY